MNIITSSTNNTQSILEQKQSVKVTEKKVEEKEVEKTFTVPIDRVDISDEARALSKSSETASNNSESGEDSSSKNAQKSKHLGTPPLAPPSDETTETEVESSSTSEEIIETLEQKIEDLEGEIDKIKESSIDGGDESIELRQKEALLATYQTQLTTLQSENT